MKQFKKIDYDTAGNFLSSVHTTIFISTLAVKTVIEYKKYQYNAFDAHGNWTERMLNEWIESDGKIEVSVKDGRKIRQIFYW